jgi:microcin C transport system substrate-binding protein
MPPLRRVLANCTAAAVLALSLAAIALPAAAQDQVIHKSHAIAMHGEAKYPPDFQHFDYVNPDAPKGGTIRFGVVGTFDSFNPYIIKGNSAAGLGFLYETLLTSSADEAFTEYGLLADSVEWPEDRSWVTFHLRPEARWHDGQPITADDVIFSLDILREKGHPFYRFYYQNIEKATRLDERTVRFDFSEGENRELPLIAGQIPILPKHYWQDREFDKTTLEPPLGSGPYKIAKFEPGRYIDWERVDDYWGKDLPVNRGFYNLDRLHYQYYLDDTVIRQALKAGDLDFRVENQAKAWAVDYDVPAVERGLLIKRGFENNRTSGMQAFAMNIRRDQFKDPRVREALSYAFDFEWTNKNLFFGQYTRTESYFANSELASSGLPEGEELEILEGFRGRIPDAVFTTEYQAPKTDGSGWPRDNLAKAFELLAEAGWVVRDLKLVNAETGNQLRFEILIVSPAFERIVLPYTRNLERLGIEAKVRLVDQSQYINRLRAFDFDMIVASWGQSESPGNEQRNFWGSESANSPSGRNLVGIADPAIDELIELLIAAPNRESLVARTRALDRVLLSHHFVVPNWHSRVDRILYWDKFSQPEMIPKSGTSWTFWWWDEAKAKLLEQRRAQNLTSEEQPDSGGDGQTWWWLLAGIAVIIGFFVYRRRSGSAAT